MRHNRFYALEMTGFVQEHQRRNMGILQLEMVLARKHLEGNGDPIPMEFLFQLHSHDAPFLIIHQTRLGIPGQGERRRKRSIIPPRFVPSDAGFQFQPLPSPAQPEPRLRCHREEWLVRPSDIGLDDILAPPLLDLGYCTGDCPFPLLNDVFNFSLHSYFIDRHR